MRTRWVALVGIALAIALLAVNTPHASAQISIGVGKGGWSGGYGGYYPGGWGGGYGGYYPGGWGGGYGGYYPGGWGGYSPGYYGSGITIGGKGWGVNIGGSSGYYNYPYYSGYYSGYYPYSSTSYYQPSYGYSYPYYSSSYPYYSGSYYSSPSYSYGYSNPSYQSSYYTPGQNYEPAQQPTGPVETVEMHDNMFKPNTMRIKQGTTVQFVNKGSHKHGLAQPHFKWQSQPVNTGEAYTWTFAESGTYHLVCPYHPEMKMTLEVEK
jgi:plastocyanin